MAAYTKKQISTLRNVTTEDLPVVSLDLTIKRPIFEQSNLEVEGKMIDNLVSLYDTEKASKLFEGLQLVNSLNSSAVIEKSLANESIPLNLAVSDKLACSFCEVTFSSRDEQKTHFKLDWHRFNLKQRLSGKACIIEAEFERIMGDVSSISGSDSEDNVDAVLTPLDNLNSAPNLPDSDDDDLENTEVNWTSVLSRNVKLIFKNNFGQLISIYKIVLYNKKSLPESQNDLLDLVTKLPNQMTWAIMMIGGGHFAGAIFKGDQVVCHKTFHRYVVRAKQGTAQGIRDGCQKGHCQKSSGAALRRHNEAALILDIQSLLETWKADLDQCNLIFLRAPSYNKRIFYQSKNKCFLDKNDPRIRSIPFITRRATFRELIRVYNFLSNIEILDENGLEIKRATPKSSPIRKPSRQKIKKEPEPKTQPIPEISPVNEEISSESEYELATSIVEFDTLHLKEFECSKKPNRTKRQHKQPKKKPPPDKKSIAQRELLDSLFSICKSGNAEKLEKLLQPLLPEDTKNQDEEIETFVFMPDTENIKSCILSDVLMLDQEPQNLESIEGIALAVKANIDEISIPVTEILLNRTFGFNSQTLLHVAAQEGHCDIVHLLLEAGTNPAIRNKQRQTPYIVSANRNTRNEFRKFMASYPDKYDYEMAQVPSPLTDNMEKDRSIKLTEKRKQIRQNKKEKTKDLQSKKVEQEEKKRFLSLSDREKRALAAERRYVAQIIESGSAPPVLSRCFQCGCDITTKVPFEYSEFKFCSMTCLKLHKQKSKLENKS